ncbi:MAG: acetyl-CoA carboxylase, biotin carboxyl carrier protein [Spirochaetes bacterium GWF1_49_6]|nr:MAG: acetyl-CoA carboxylase, biotin carboxyl carrier protein [Spirochaetes bacterium GWF1_49_6]
MSKTVCGIDAEVLKEIGDIFAKTNVEEIELEEEDKFYIKVSRIRPDMPVMAAAPAAMAAPVAAAAPAAVPAAAAPVAAPAAAQYDNADKYHKILSPVIGSYYESSTPGGNPFVKVGDTVSPDTTVCIVEAMKVMNEIKAEIKGKIVSVAKSNGESVLANEVLFVVEKK